MTAIVIQLDHRHAALANARKIVRSATASPVTVMMACDVLDTGNADDADLSRQLRWAMRPSLAAEVNEAARQDTVARMFFGYAVVIAVAIVTGIAIAMALQNWWLHYFS